MTIDKISESIARDWYDKQGEWVFSMDELRSIGFEVSSEEDAEAICTEIKTNTFSKMYNLILKEIYK
tara:strand:+ start:258 stop:458 length:201 start_codon:yes stop_codon:yes gene_type:complete